jgi:thioredoxin reductase (NADPH)
MIYPIAVIGGGSGGVMALLRTILNNQPCLFFPGSGKDRKKSRAFWVSKVENIPGYFHYKKGIEEPNLETIDWILKSPFEKNFHYKKNRGVVSIKRKEDGLFIIEDDQQETYLCQYVVLATGVMDIQPHIEGSIKSVLPYANVSQIDYCLRCDGHHTLGKHTSVIGHNNNAGWVAIMLHERYQNPSMTIFTNGVPPTFEEEVWALINLYKIKIYDQEIIELKGDGKTLKGMVLKDGTFVESEISFVSLGMMVHNHLVKELGVSIDERGFVLTNEKGESSIPNLFIVGDLRAHSKKQIYTAWDQAVDSADTIDSRIRRDKRSKSFLSGG